MNTVASCCATDTKGTLAVGAEFLFTLRVVVRDIGAAVRRYIVEMDGMHGVGFAKEAIELFVLGLDPVRVVGTLNGPSEGEWVARLGEI